MTRVCEVGGVFRRCHGVSVAVCQYCGRDFCAEHTGKRVGEEEVCSRPRCLAKFDDLKAHIAYREQAVLRSARGICGTPGCENRRAGQCSKCQAYFCDQHLRDRTEHVREGWTRVSRPVCVCDHCAGRLKLWSRQ